LREVDGDVVRPEIVVKAERGVLGDDTFHFGAHGFLVWFALALTSVDTGQQGNGTVPDLNGVADALGVDESHRASGFADVPRGIAIVADVSDTFIGQQAAAQLHDLFLHGR